jgi:FAD synthase
LYGRTLEIAFVDRLRDEHPFASPAHLQAQIHEDIARARRVLGAKKFKESLYRHA